MKFGTDIDKYGYQFSKYFKTCQLFSLSSYAILNTFHNEVLTRCLVAKSRAMNRIGKGSLTRRVHAIHVAT